MIDNCSVVIPFYQGYDSIPDLIKQINSVFLNEYKLVPEIVIVDDSNNHDILFFKNLKKDFNNIRCLILASNHGQFYATNCGVNSSTGRYIITIDEDLQYSPQEIVYLINKLRSKNLDIVYGLPKARKNHIINKIFSPFVYLSSYILGLKKVSPKGYISSFRAFKSEFKNKAKNKNLNTPLDIWITKHVSKNKISFLEVQHSKSSKNISLLNRLISIIKGGISYYKYTTYGNLIVSLILTIVAFLLTNLIFIMIIIFPISMAILYLIRNNILEKNKKYNILREI